MVVLDVILLIGVLLFAAVGWRRGPWPEVVVLAGLMLGALLGDEWGDVWGGDLGSAFGFLGSGGARLIVRSLLFLVPLIGIGYGGALLLPTLGRPSARARLVGALLGLFNGAAIFAILLRNWYYSQGTPGGALVDDPGTGFLLNWAGWWSALLALGGLGAVLWAALGRPRTSAAPNRPGRRSATPPVLASPGSPAPASSTPDSTPASTPISTPAPASALPLAGSSSPAPRPALTIEPAASNPAPSRSNGAGAGQERRCRTCNHVLAPGAAFCPNCGTPV